jgi:osmotically-inducible protein OsmY
MSDMLSNLKSQSKLNDRVAAAIAQNPYLAARRLDFDSEGGNITLRGEVNSYFQKQMAQEAIRSLDGVSGIENHLEVSCCWLPLPTEP